MAEEVVILMNDCPGIKLPGKISSTVGKYIPGLSSPSPHNVLRGELLVPIKSKHASQDNGRPHVNYIVKKDPNIILYCKAEDVSPLVENLKDSWLLEGIESLSVRHALFIGGKKLEWGSHLVINDTVYSSIPGPNPLVRQCVTAIIRYIGQVKGLPGCQFGIEIMDDAVRGNGANDGTFNGQRYFHCEDGCGLVLSLDKISCDPIPVGIQGQHQKTSAASYASALRNLGPDPPSNSNRSRAGKESSTDPPARPCQFNMDEKVVFYDKKGNEVHGTVCWCGMKTKMRNFGYMVVGIITESKVSNTDFESSVVGITHLISAPKGHALFLPESLVTSLQGKSLPTKKSASDVDVNNSVSVAKAFGVSREELIRQQTEAMQQAKQTLSAKDDWRGSSQQQRAHGAPPQGSTYTPEMARVDKEQKLRKQVSQPSNHYEPIPGIPSSAEHRNLHGQRLSTSIEDRPNVQAYSGSQNPLILQQNVALQTRPPVIEQQNVAAGLSSPSQPSHWQPLDVGSTIQIPSTEYDRPMRYGVIRWIGELPGVQGLIAGIELEEEMDGCTDGMWSTTGQAFFHCPPGKGLYYGLYNLKPDSRFNAGSSISLDLLHQQQTEVQSGERIKQENTRLLAELQEQLHHEKQEKQQAQQELLACKSELSSQKRKLSLCEKELAARSTDVWKVSRDKVEAGNEIGVGGWGTVFKGKIQVAMKRLHPAILNPQYIAKIRREMKLLAEVHHPNLVQFIGTVFDEEAEKDRKPPLIITELLDMNLRQAYEQKELQPGDSLSIFIDVARALDYLHQRYEPIIHRDVSAPNVLLQRLPNNRWKGKVSDLGSANFLQNAQTKGEGAILYSPPEVIPRAYNPSRKRIPQTVKIDVYSYGVLLCEVITSKLPTEEDYGDMIEQVQIEHPQMYELIVHCTKEDPMIRPTMAEVIVKLEKMPQM